MEKRARERSGEFVPVKGQTMIDEKAAEQEQTGHRIAPVVLRLAKRIQRIEHNDRHTWQTCAQSARDRAVLQAKAVLEELGIRYRRFFIAEDNSKPPQLWVWRGEQEEDAEPWQRIPE